MRSLTNCTFNQTLLGYKINEDEMVGACILHRGQQHRKQSLVTRPETKRLKKSRRKWEDNIKKTGRQK
jgi:hypothetical protein